MNSATEYGATTTFSSTNSSRGRSIDQLGQMTPMSQLTNTKTSDADQTAEYLRAHHAANTFLHVCAMPNTRRSANRRAAVRRNMLSFCIVTESATMPHQWLNPKYLHGTSMTTMRDRFAENDLLIIDDFLEPIRLERLQMIFQEPEGWEDRFAGYGAMQSHTSNAEWNALPDSKRFYHYQEFIAPIGGRELAKTVLGYVQARMFLTSPSFAEWLERVTGLPIGMAEVGQARRMAEEHFLRRHDDDNDDRVLCLVLYLSEEWKAEFGGTLTMFNGETLVHKVEPVPGRALLFRPSINFAHQVEPITPGTSPWQRRSLSTWYRAG